MHQLYCVCYSSSRIVDDYVTVTGQGSDADNTQLELE